MKKEISLGDGKENAVKLDRFVAHFWPVGARARTAIVAKSSVVLGEQCAL
jgi:hypothetical protein